MPGRDAAGGISKWRKNLNKKDPNAGNQDYAELANTLASLRKETEALKRATRPEKPRTAEERLRRVQEYSSEGSNDEEEGRELTRKQKLN